MKELQLFESGLIDVYQEGDEQLVNARDLYEVLEVKTPFNKWIKRRIEKYGFQENIDYLVTDIFVPNSSGGKQTVIHYILKLDMAKELAMIEPNDKGRKIRLYFINAEKHFKKWLQQRANGKLARLEVTDAVRDYIPESPNKKFKYKHFTDLVYKLVFDKNAKQIREEKGLDKKENVRDYLSKDELQEVGRIENEIGVLIGVGFDYAGVKKILHDKYAGNPKRIAN